MVDDFLPPQVQLPPPKQFFFRNAMWFEKRTGVYYEYDIIKYISKQEIFNDQPHFWEKNWRIRFIGCTDEQLSNQHPIFVKNINDILAVGQVYALKDHAKFYFDKESQKDIVGLEFYGLEFCGLFNPEFFETLKEPSVYQENPFEIILKNPPENYPEYGSEEYLQLFKETAGNSVGTHGDEEIGGHFDYVDHIRVTRKPEEYPEWLKEAGKPSKAVRRNKPKSIGTSDYFNQPKPNNPFLK